MAHKRGDGWKLAYGRSACWRPWATRMRYGKSTAYSRPATPGWWTPTSCQYSYFTDHNYTSPVGGNEYFQSDSLRHRFFLCRDRHGGRLRDRPRRADALRACLPSWISFCRLIMLAFGWSRIQLRLPSLFPLSLRVRVRVQTAGGSEWLPGVGAVQVAVATASPPIRCQ